MAYRNHNQTTIRPRFCLILLCVILLFAAGFRIGQDRLIRLQNDTLDQLTQEYEEALLVNAKLKQELQYMETDEFILREARDKLGWMLPGDILFQSK